jgi:signal transduction histidine kinase
MRECAAEIKALLRDTQITLLQELDCSFPVRMDRDKLRRAILNIATNAKQALKGKGEFKLTTRLIGAHAVIELLDNGEGIPEDLHAKIFEPFFTHGKSGGFGLGMSITHKIIDEHAGKISLESERGKGTTFIIEIPIAQTSRQTQSMANFA